MVKHTHELLLGKIDRSHSHLLYSTLSLHFFLSLSAGKYVEYCFQPSYLTWAKYFYLLVPIYCIIGSENYPELPWFRQQMPAFGGGELALFYSRSRFRTDSMQASKWKHPNKLQNSTKNSAIWKKRLNSTVSSKQTEAKQQARQEIEQICPPNRRDDLCLAFCFHLSSMGWGRGI